MSVCEPAARRGWSLYTRTSAWWSLLLTTKKYRLGLFQNCTLCSLLLSLRFIRNDVIYERLQVPPLSNFELFLAAFLFSMASMSSSLQLHELSMDKLSLSIQVLMTHHRHPMFSSQLPHSQLTLLAHSLPTL